MQRTSRRQAAIIILLGLTLLAIAMFTQLGKYAELITPTASDYPQPSPTPYIIYSMYAINGYEGEVVAGPRVQPLSPLVLKRIQEEISRVLTAEANGSEVVYQAVIITPPPDPATVKDGSSQEPIDPEVLKEMRRRALQMAASVTSVPAEGPTTLGKTIEVAGKAIQLPPDVYIDATVMAIDCIAGKPCPEAPMYVLRYKGTELKIGVTMRTGEMHMFGADAAKDAASMAAFQWLTETLAK